MAFFIFLFLTSKHWCLVFWLVVGTVCTICLGLFCTLLDHSKTISLVWMTHDFFFHIDGFLHVKILVFFCDCIVLFTAAYLLLLLAHSLQVGRIYFYYVSLFYYVSGIVLLFPITSESNIGLMFLLIRGSIYSFIYLHKRHTFFN